MTEPQICLLSFIEDFAKQHTLGNQAARWREQGHTAAYVLDMPLRQRIVDATRRLALDARCDDPARLEYLHRVLAAIYDYRFSVPDVATVDIDFSPLFADIASLLEAAMLDAELNPIDEDIFWAMPTEGEAFVEWLKRTMSDHPAAVHTFYREYLRDAANVESLKVFLAQETTLDPRFDDILALMQVGTSGTEKMEIAKNYYDEMGCGDASGVHTYLFSKTLDALGIDSDYVNGTLLPDSRVSGNLSACLVLSQRHHYKAVGYFGVTEYLAPRRFKDLVAGWRRLGLPEEGIAYHDLHIRIDAIHGRAWLDNVIRPLVDHDPRVAREIALGALIRLNSSARYLDKLQSTLVSRDASACAESLAV
ncbi:iron-containing redox enzyme family protein [Paraburkholderia antibiotica]|uniref:Iron-containing redox enzyme family protein n=1 Tax=Paraburkholderia antibiotica TaxID=2728839 RepID=A0A7X9X5Z7_9BURK|nr:iron-containing redox enzyme family protein [Paraburkholderia antibiotica]NML31729.1 iron-containing redox enzyme family protein [Paraburkholderia antibiotica]